VGKNCSKSVQQLWACLSASKKESLKVIDRPFEREKKKKKKGDEKRGMERRDTCLLSLPLVLVLSTTKALIVVALGLHKLHVVGFAVENALK